MKLHYFSAVPNFGDALNPWLWPQLIGDLLDADESRLFVGIGSILNPRVPRASSYHVFGSGCGYGPIPLVDHRWRFHAVRGPLSARALALPADAAVTDAAYLLRTVPLPAPRPGAPIGYMPHFEAMPRVPWRQLVEGLGLRFIDPVAPVPEVIAEIRGCSNVLAEAMHGAIVADACGVPWIPVATGRHVADFKWRDWLATVDLEYRPRRLARLYRIAPHRPGEGRGAALLRRFLNASALSLQCVPLKRNLSQLVSAIRSGRTPLQLSTENLRERRTTELRRRLEQMRLEINTGLPEPAPTRSP